MCHSFAAPRPAHQLPIGITMNAVNSPGLSCIIPIRVTVPDTRTEFRDYIEWLSSVAEVIIVDGSSAEVFAAHDTVWGDVAMHVAPHADLMTDMGKVGGVLTGVRLASNERIIIADDDVRYDPDSLAAVKSALTAADVVRPQNYFYPLPWHARWDTGRTLLNRMTGGDWPGTLGVRKSILSRAGGYDGSVMFENLELVRTVIAAGGTETVLSSAYVRRLPSSSRHFWSQRVRQAYDEFARPLRLLTQLALLPSAALASFFSPAAIAVGAVGIIALAEMGRRRLDGRRYFPADTSLFAVAWVSERAVCSWIALGSRIIFGGVKYRGSLLRRSATPMSVLRHRFRHLREQRTGLNPGPAALRQSA